MEKARGFWAFLHTPKTRFDLKDSGKAFCYFVILAVIYYFIVRLLGY